MRRALMIMVLALAAVLGAAGGAQALVMSGGALRRTSVWRPCRARRSRL